MNLTMIPQLINDHGYSLMMNTYEAYPTVRERIGQVVPIPADGSVAGDKGDVLSTVGRPAWIRPGQSSPRDQIGSAYTWYMAVHKMSRSLEFTKEMIAASDASGRLQRKLEDAGREFGQTFQDEKEDFVAGMLQDGTLTAGSAPTGHRPGYFDGSFPGNADPYSTVIYDGLPWFDTAHTDFADTSTTKANHTVTAALTDANLKTTLTTMRVTNAVNYRGDLVSINPNTLLVPTALGYTARTLLNSQQLAGSANNDVNVLRGSLDVIDWARLSDDTDAWWLLEAGKGLRIADSGAPVISSYYDEDRQVMVVLYTSYFGATITDWRYSFCCNKAAA